MLDRKTLIIACCILFVQSLFGQDVSQTIRGVVIDKDSKMELIGADVMILNTNPLLGTSTDIDGSFRLDNVPVGRHDLVISYIGYEDQTLGSILLSSGKELVLNIELTESILQLDQVVVKAELDKTKSLNEMASVSARSFSVEETARYAAGNFDPARMAQNYAGVTVGGATSDLFNEIVIRGNSPRTVLWRLEGIEIPNPNHFSSLGNSGGAISMLSSSTLSNSDFYTGAFPSEFGNALSGVFDLNLRTGNNEKREYSFMIGALGLEGAAEGPFVKGGKSSYLINYRYSTLAALAAVGLSPTGDVLPAYQDLSFKFNFPTEDYGVISLFGLGGRSHAVFAAEKDSTEWEESDDAYGFDELTNLGILGLSHRILLNDKSYLRTVVSATGDKSVEEEYRLDTLNNYAETDQEYANYSNWSYRISTMYNNKLNARNTVRAGAIFSHMGFQFKYDEYEPDTKQIVNYFDNKNSTNFMQAYAQWKHRFNDEWTLNTGVHYSHLLFNNASSIEPRVSLKYQFAKNQSLSGSVGLHSKLEHIAIYIFEGETPDGDIVTPAKDLQLSKAMHAVLGYDYSISKNLRLKAELYYQHLYDVPIESTPDSKSSIINGTDIIGAIGAEHPVNDGKGRNYGIDLTLEKFFSNQYYFMLTGSLFESKYTPQDGKEYDTRFNSNFQATLLGGKEFKVGKKKNSIFGINGKFVTSGGNRFTPVDFAASELAGEEVVFEDRPFEEFAGTYYRFDIGLSYKINKAKATHTIMIDIQNVTNRENVYSTYYDVDSNSLKQNYQNGLFPTFNYRVEF